MKTSYPQTFDLPSIQELVRSADPEGLIEIHETPADEYVCEARQILAAVQHLPSSELLVLNILTPIEGIWRKSFSLSDEELAQRRPALLSLAKEIERFFGPESQPRTRQQILDIGGTEA